MAKQPKIYVYGHYDSRGGTMGIKAATKREADAEYNKAFDGGSAAKTDFIAACVITGDDPKTTLLSFDMEEVGAVFVVGPGINDEFPSKESIKDATLRFVADPDYIADPAHSADKLLVIPEGCHHPRWEDDAFGFWYVDLTRGKKNKRKGA